MAAKREVASYREALAYLEKFTNYERTMRFSADSLGLERIRTLLDALGNPQEKYPCLHIAGTKGKGSTSAFATRLLMARGMKVGLYTSPHLLSLRERIQMGGALISQDLFCKCLQEVRDALVNLPPASDGSEPATYFEIMTALAFQAFAREKVDAAVIEVGLGGRLDATNILRPIACAITTISLDHTSVLGDTVEKIAAEKAGIIKPGVPVISGPQSQAAKKVIAEAARAAGTKFHAWGEEIKAEVRRDRENLANPDRPQRINVSTWRGHYEDILLPMLGRHQADNAAVAAGLVEAFFEVLGKPQLNEAMLRKAWQSLRIPARIEVLGRQPWLVIDGAHNPASVWALCETVRERFAPEKIALVFGAAKDKDSKSMLRILLPLVKQLYATEIGTERELSAKEIAAMATASGFSAVLEEADPAKAVIKAQEFAGPRGLVLVTGSMYLAGRVMASLGSEKLLAAAGVRG